MRRKIFPKSHLLWSTLGPYKNYAILLFIVLLLGAIFEAVGLGMIIPFIGSFLGSNTIEDNNEAISYFYYLFSKIVPWDHRLLAISIMVFAIFLVKNILGYMKAVLSIDFYNKLRKHWSCRIMDEYIQADYEYIIQQKRGTLINNLINEPMLASKLLGQLVEYLSQSVIALCIYCVMLIVNWRITVLLSIVVFSILGIIWKISTEMSTSIGVKRLVLNQEIVAEGEELLTGIRQVKLFSRYDSISKGFSKKYSELKKILVHLGMFRNILAPLGEIILVLCIVLVLLYSEYFGEAQTLSVLPILAFFVVASQRLYQKGAILVSGRMMFLAYLPALKVVDSVLNKGGIGKEVFNKGVNISELSGDILFDGVTFSHRESKILFRDLSFRIPKCKITAIVGKSGNGKSTIVDLICGLYKGYNGRIMCGDYELGELNLASWRKIIGVVSQEPFLFNASVKENILVGKPNATEEEIVTAATMANAHEFVMSLPKGYDTVLGDRGLKISGGQRQRITVARALIRSPQLLIFDEATSSLDTETERLIQKSIEGLKGEKTIIIISHRLSTIENADLIYILDKGRVIESGSYEELLANRDAFK